MKLIRGNDRINRLAQRADIAEGVSRIRAEMAEANRTYNIGQWKRETENEEQP